ncbi:MAG: hypothetical protein KHX03_06805 [Clostridium sp.]|nr:hypothetical protein [Clostridium sp.]
MMGVETIGHFDVKKIGDNKYSVVCNNGNIGACIMDKAGVDALREKYNRSKDTVEFEDKQPAEKSEKRGSAGKAVASAFLPGLGQFCDGRTKDGFKDLGRHILLPAVGTAAGIAGYLNFAKAVEAGAKTGMTKTPYGFYAAIGVAALAGIGTFANWIHSVVDAYKGGKK